MPSRPFHAFLLSNFRMVRVRCSAGSTVPLFFQRRLHSRIPSTVSQKPTSRFLLCSSKSSKSAWFRPRPPVVPSRTVHDIARTDDGMDPGQRFTAMKSKLEEEGIKVASFNPGQYSRSICPKCGGGTTKETSLSLFAREDGELVMWSCFRAKCGWKGNMTASGVGKSYHVTSNQTSKAYRVISEEDLQLEPLCEELITYFSVRMISAETLRRNYVMQRNYNEQVVIAFTYRRHGLLVSCKYRGVNKKFWQEKDTERIFYGVDDIKQAGDIIIVEGEIDKLSMEEAGFRNCVSVPDGAPSKVSKEPPDEQEDTKFQFLWNCKTYLEKASRIILATDGDLPGQALAEELARRLGKERCWRIKWPMKNATEFCKDANEVLMYLGPTALKEVIEDAELYPIRGLLKFSEFFHDIDAYYNCSLGYELGISTGWRGLDHLYKVVPGELTVITGAPNSGKSEWIDAVLCNINKTERWPFALSSMENKVQEHARKLLEKHIKKPFLHARYGESVQRMSVEELEEGKKWLNDTFHLIRCDDDCLPSIKWVLELAKAAVLRYGVRGLVIDPYNELDHQRPANQTETEYVSQMLTKIKRFAQHHSCHVWFVAHPKQLQQWGGGPPNLYDISGSAHFINKCDNGIVIHRNRDEKSGPLDLVQVCVRKVRNKVIGNIGDAYLSYNRNFSMIPLGTVCVAGVQFKGRGRAKNVWESPDGCLLFSFTLEMEDGHKLPLLQYVVSLAMTEAVRELCQAKVLPRVDVRIKWPNDLYLNGLKVGGILCTSTYRSKKFHVCAGVGLNLDNEKPTTCLNTVLQETGSSHQLKKEDVLASFFNKFENMYEIFLNQGFQVLEELYQTTWLHSGQKVVIEEKHEGQSVEKTIVTIQGLTSAGYLLAIGEDNENYELHPDGNSFDFFKGLVRRKLG